MGSSATGQCLRPLILYKSLFRVSSPHSSSMVYDQHPWELGVGKRAPDVPISLVLFLGGAGRFPRCLALPEGSLGLGRGSHPFASFVQTELSR